MSGCKNCGGAFSTDGSMYSFDLIRYSHEEVQIIPVSDGGIFKIDVDAGTFCCDSCMVAYLAKKPDFKNQELENLRTAVLQHAEGLTAECHGLIEALETALGQDYMGDGWKKTVGEMMTEARKKGGV